jgi:hypothetical protein
MPIIVAWNPSSGMRRFYPKIWVYAARKMYVIGIVEMEETVSILSREEPAVSFSLEEFERYVDLFEEMLERIEEEGELSECKYNQDELDWTLALDEFDLAEIAGMRARFGSIREA